MRRLAPVFAGLVAAAASCATSAAADPPVATASAELVKLPAAVPSVAEPVSLARFRDHLATLASDAFDGRKPGTRGGKLATNYIKQQFQKLGLRPGNHGAWLQSVPTVQITLANTDTALAIATKSGVDKLAYRDDMIVNNLSGKAAVELTNSPVVFAGYGVAAPEQDWNDYAGIDVRGKTVIVLVNDPGFGNNDASLFKGRAMTYYGRWTYKFEEAARHGAAACFIVHDDAGAGYAWSVVQSSWSGPQFDLPAPNDPAPRLDVAGWLSTAAARRLFSDAGADFDTLRAGADRRGFKPIELPAHAAIRLRSTIRRGQSDNVVALLPGQDRPGEVLVYSAHWDHLGRDNSLQGDKIYNGAVDNATGVAALLAIAEAYTRQQPAPRRSVLFVALTLEESGLLGSKFYAAHPAFAASDTVADINMDAMYLLGRAHNMSIVGYGQSELDAVLERALGAQGRYVSAEEAPEKGHFFRSDHFNFARMGIPALYAKSGLDLLDGGEAAGRAAVDEYTSRRYHKPGDEFHDDQRLDGVIEDAQALYAVGRELAQSGAWPQWAADSEFRAVRDAQHEATPRSAHAAK
ncbi:MAG: M28 family metallopeptidase [Tahibacter sp.]